MRRRPTVAELRSKLLYDARTGLFKHINPHPYAHKGWFAGTPDERGYRNLWINRMSVKAHRAAWAMVFGEWPKRGLDHKDRDHGNNRIGNLREATVAQNQWNAGKQRTNTSGFKGAFKIKRSARWNAEKWRAQITQNGRKIQLGYFDSPQEAHAAYCAAANELHGEYACHE